LPACACHSQPDLASYSLAVGTNVRVAEHGKLAGDTDLALLMRLLQPRGMLKVTPGNSVLLAKRPAGCTARIKCDVIGGPSVTNISVPMTFGIRSWIVVQRIEADVREINPAKEVA